jgi:hypothetical protein
MSTYHRNTDTSKLDYFSHNTTVEWALMFARPVQSPTFTSQLSLSWVSKMVRPGQHTFQQAEKTTFISMPCESASFSPSMVQRMMKFLVYGFDQVGFWMAKAFAHQNTKRILADSIEFGNWLHDPASNKGTRHASQSLASEAINEEKDNQVGWWHRAHHSWGC